MLTDRAGWQFCCMLVCIWMKSGGAVCLDNPSQVSIAGQSCGQAGKQPTNTELSAHHKILQWASTGFGKCGWGIGWWSWSCCRACVEWNGLSRGSWEREKSARKRLRGRRELLPGGRLSSPCLPWDSSAALNMPVIFNQRRNRAQRRPPLWQYCLSVRRGNGGEPHFLVTWCSPGNNRHSTREVGKSKRGEERELGWLPHTHTIPHIHSAPPFSKV